MRTTTEVEIEIDDVIERFSLSEILDEYDLEDIIEYVERRQSATVVLYQNPQAIRAALQDIASTRISPNLTSCKDCVRGAINEIINDIF